MKKKKEVDLIKLVTQIVPLIIIIMVMVTIIPEIMDALQTSNVSYDNINQFDLYDDEPIRDWPKPTPPTKILPPVDDSEQYKTEEIDYDKILDDIGQDYMDHYSINDTFDYDDSLGDLLGGI